MSEEVIGSRKGDYEILGVLGAGGMGKVYKVRNVLSDRVEAMKVLLPNLADQKELGERFLREIKVLGGLNHPNIAALRTALTIDNQLVMIMEYVEGSTLGSRIERGPIPCAEALNYIDQVLAALSFAHQRQIIHRDIKPSNMMLTPDGTIKLMDFGIARSGPDAGLTMTGTTLGSLAYMSPEQVRCEPIDGRSDLYSVGVSLYEMVTGQRPFQADSNFAIMQAHLKEVPRQPIELKPDLPVSVSKIIVMAMEKEPAQRFQSADAFRGALKSVASELGVALSPARSGATAVHSAAGDATVRRTSPTVPAAGPGGAPVSPTQGSPAQMPPPQAGGSHRGRYIALGAVIVLVVLVAAGLTIPRWFGTRAQEQSKGGATKSEPAPSTAAPAASAEAEPSKIETTPSKDVESGKGREDGAKLDTSTKGGKKGSGAPGEAKPQPPPPPPGPDPAVVAELEKEVDDLSSRQGSLNATLDNMKQAQANAGYGLRGDMVSAQQRMNINVQKATAAFNAQDLEGAKRYLKLAEGDVEKLEKFLGR
jgi:eukaryotic-like serine/threonine-protein kinase